MDYLAVVRRTNYWKKQKSVCSLALQQSWPKNKPNTNQKPTRYHGKYSNPMKHPDFPWLVAINVRCETRDGIDHLVIRSGHHLGGGQVLKTIPDQTDDSTLFLTNELQEHSEGSIGQVAAQIVRGYTVLGYIDKSMIEEVQNV